MRTLRLGARGSLGLLFAINLANYVDRYVVVGLGERIQGELRIPDEDWGWLASAFILVYMAASPVCGYIADRVARRWVIASAVGLWSVATAVASRAGSFGPLFLARSGVGIGESGYNASGQALLADLFPPERRNRALSIFNMALPVGAAIGFLLAGVLPTLGPRGAPLGWRGSLLVVGLPGLLLAVLALFLPDPGEETTHGAPVEAKKHESTLAAYKRFLTDPVYMADALGFAMQSFALGGLATFAPQFLARMHEELTPEKATLYAGAVVAGAGLLGTLLGMVLGDRFAKRGNLIQAYALVTGLGYLASVPFLVLGLYLPLYPSLGCLFLAMVGAFLGTGPSNAIITERAPSAHRASAFALLIVLLHLLGDAASPVVIGKISTLSSAAGLAPGPALRQGLLPTPVALLLAAVAMGLCALAARREAAGGAGSARGLHPV